MKDNQQATGSDVRLTEEEARAIADLHAKRRELQGQPTIQELAEQLNISEPEAMAMLTEVRARQSKPQPMPPVVMAQDRHGMSSTTWALVSLVVAAGVLFAGIFTVRSVASSRDQMTEAATPVSFEPPVKVHDSWSPPIPPSPDLHVKDRTQEVIIDKNGVQVIKDGKVTASISRDMKAANDEARTPKAPGN